MIGGNGGAFFEVFAGLAGEELDESAKLALFVILTTAEYQVPVMKRAVLPIIGMGALPASPFWSFRLLCFRS